MRRDAILQPYEKLYHVYVTRTLPQYRSLLYRGLRLRHAHHAQR